jgi:diguanylate cyclase (GGDEF)-like protein/PAS domain S-box-containing protein
MNRELSAIKLWEFPILVVEDDPGLAGLIRSTLEDHGFSCELLETAQGTIERLTTNHQVIMLLDYTLPDMTGATLVETLGSREILPPFIMITGREDAGLAVSMMKLGARDYVVKDLDFLDDLPASVIRVIQELQTESRLNEAVEALRESEARLAKAQHLSRMGSWEYNLGTGAVTWSTGMFRIIGTQRQSGETLTLESLYRHVHPDDLAVTKQAITDLIQTRTPFNLDFRLMCETGQEIVVNSQAELELASDGTPLFISGTLLDISDRKRAENEIQQLAYYDTLTTLPNRALLQDRINQATSQAARDGRTVAVMFLDLDRFKSVNDTMGHAIGDRLLKVVADRLSRCIRDSDTVARLGGDEFVIILNAINSADDVVCIAEKVQRILAKPVTLGDHEIYTTASIGIALFPLDGTDVNTLLKNADIAMYQAKEQGRNTFQFFSREMNVQALEHLMLETSLRRGLERDEFHLVYQPLLDLKDGRLVGMEALVRWQHPDLGLLLPGKFIPIAEETGMIIPLGDWVLAAACRQNRQWLDEGLPPLRVAVNLSARQFAQSNLARRVADILTDTGLPPNCLELELTESTIMSNAEATITILQELKAMGISLAIDDFGTGYSSLSYLKHFPIDRLKIDRSFVCDITTNPDDAAIADAIIAMAHSLKLKVTAEGVEKQEQLRYLAARHCDEMQGYILSYPINADEFARFVREGIEKPGWLAYK